MVADFSKCKMASIRYRPYHHLVSVLLYRGVWGKK